MCDVLTFGSLLIGKRYLRENNTISVENVNPYDSLITLLTLKNKTQEQSLLHLFVIIFEYLVLYIYISFIPLKATFTEFACDFIQF